jgi:hypothetical protein
MPILKNSGKKGIAGKIVGVVFPKGLHSYFSLFALAKGLTKSIIVTEEMKKWHFHASKVDREDVLISELIIRIKAEWELIHGEDPDCTLSIFKRMLKRELIRKGISENHIEIILKQIN